MPARHDETLYDRLMPEPATQRCSYLPVWLPARRPVQALGCWPNTVYNETINMLLLMPGLPTAAEAAERATDPHIEAVQQRVRTALGLPADHRVSFVDLHDAMTSMQTHGKPIPEGGWAGRQPGEGDWCVLACAS